MKETVLSDQDLKLILKASIDYNSLVLGVTAQALNNQYKPKKIFRELDKATKAYNNILKGIMSNYVETPEPYIDPKLHSTYP